MILLKCVKEHGKLRIKFHAFVDDKTGVEYQNAYNNTYNCKFPKDIRQEGRIFSVRDADMTLTVCAKKPFYSISTKNIVILRDELSTSVSKVDRVFNVEECVVCLSSSSTVIFLPCAHQCVCQDCHLQLKQNEKMLTCLLCRRGVEKTIIS